MIQLRARIITPAAHLWLADTTHARLLNVFEHACNLVNQNGAVMALVTPSLPLAPFALQVEAANLHGLTAADAVRVTSTELYVGRWHIDTTHAQVWSPIADWATARRAVTNNPDLLDSLARHAIASCAPGTLLELYTAPNSNTFLKLFARGATNLVNGMRTHSLNRAIDGARQLAGLGQGLTPGGDDFIIGVMFAAWSGLYGTASKAFCIRLAQTAAPRTTTLSGAFLHAAARGEAMSVWHTLLTAFARPSDFVPALQALFQVGHTSGADALAGFIASHFWSETASLADAIRAI